MAAFTPKLEKRLLDAKVDTFNKSVKQIRTETLKVLKAHEVLDESITRLAGQLRLAGQQESLPEMKNMLQESADLIEMLEEERRKNLIGRLRGTVIQILNQYPKSNIRPMKKSIGDRTNRAVKYEKAEGTLNQLVQRQNTDPTKLEKAKVTRDIEAKNAAHATENMTDSLIRYERQRVRDTKVVIEEYIRSNIHFHCRAIELLSRACQSISAVDVDDSVNLLLSEIPSLPQYMQSTQLPELAPIDGQMRLNNSQTNPTPIVQNDLKALKKSASLPQDTQERPELARRSLTQGPSHFNRALSAEEDISGEGTGIEEIK